MNNKVLSMIYISFFAILIAICSWISIPGPVPFTLQTFAVFISLILLGGKRGSICILLYILLGVIGIPVFSGFKGGIGVLLGTTGGYILGFILSALVFWLITSLLGKKPPVIIIAVTAGLLICYAFGTIWFMVIYTGANGSISLWSTLLWCVIPFIIPDIIKIVLAILLGKKLSKHITLS